MIVIPAIDLRNGQCVRLRHGKIEEETVYSADPVAVAKKWQSLGAKRIHVIDLDGAFSGRPKNLEWILRIKKETSLMVQMGGGLRTMEAIDALFGAGIDRAILGTIVFEEAGLARQAFEKYREKIMVALDVKNGMVAVRGWKNDSGFPMEEALPVIEKLGGREIIYTDIEKDGTLEGVNLNRVIHVMKLTPMSVYASGGVGSLKDIETLASIKCPGCIVGKALYDKKLDLAQAIAAAG